MLTKILLENFRCYNKHEIEFKNLTVIVGKNNAGKSTVVEALRLISFSINRFTTSTKYSEHPDWLELPKRAKGISPTLKNLNINFENIFHKYAAPPAIITAFFSRDYKITIYIGGEKNIFCTLTDTDNNYMNNKREAVKFNLDSINALPQIEPLQREEKVLGQDYIQQNLSSDISSLHFRNQIYLYYEYFSEFKEFAENYWHGIKLLPLEKTVNFENNKLSLLIQDSDFVSEVGWVGHGLQMWLQIMWFLSRINKNGVVILDEPDVYMHPDLQRKLIRLLTSKFNQIIISTHSVEIISEVEAENILIIDKQRSKSIFANNVPVVQRILNSIGSIHNLQLTKLWVSKKLLIVEGDDIDILKKLQYKLYPVTQEPFDTIPNFNIGGWGGWNYAKGSSMLLKETVDSSVKIYCLFDSDYHSEEEIKQRFEDAKTLNVNLHILKRKEIENYLICANTIYKILTSDPNRKFKGDIKDIDSIIVKEAEKLREDTVMNLADEMHKQGQYKGHQMSSILKKARLRIDSITYRVSGKQLISSLSKWTQTKYGITLSPLKLAQNIDAADIDDEIVSFIHNVEYSK